VSYTQFESLYLNYSKQGLEILGFPCNQFGNQEPGTNEEILEFAQKKFHATFQMFSKIDVNGPSAHPLFKFLEDGQDIRWNFEKFLCDRNGKLFRRYSSAAEPFSFRKDILFLLSQGDGRGEDDLEEENDAELL